MTVDDLKERLANLPGNAQISLCLVPHKTTADSSFLEAHAVPFSCVSTTRVSDGHAHLLGAPIHVYLTSEGS